MMVAFPVLDEPLHAVIGATVTDFLQTFEQSMSTAASRPCQLRLFFQPLREFAFKLAKLRGDRLNPFVFGFFYRIEVFAYRWSRQPHFPVDGRNRLLLQCIAPAYFVNDVHVKHSRYPRHKYRMVTYWGGNYWTLFDTCRIF